jgi:hypothetical protein
MYGVHEHFIGCVYFKTNLLCVSFNSSVRKMYLTVEIRISLFHNGKMFGKLYLPIEIWELVVKWRTHLSKLGKFRNQVFQENSLLVKTIKQLLLLVLLCTTI